MTKTVSGTRKSKISEDEDALFPYHFHKSATIININGSKLNKTPKFFTDEK